MKLKESLKEFFTDFKQLGLPEALFQQHLRGRYPEVELQDQDGKPINKGLLTSFDEKSLVFRSRADYGYVNDISPVSSRVKLVTPDRQAITPALFKQLVEARVGKGYLERLKAQTDKFAHSLGIPDQMRGK